ncbi:phosphoribosyltransferase-like protein [Paraburkholderia phytofirmans]|uniref:phosphoribosyltransferase-like protein n=1 Tax=Paraburkholderia phytofirmans TaxID=261302 RepID=UPI0038B8CE2A
MNYPESPIDSWIQYSVEYSQKTVRLKQLYELQAEFLFNQYEPTKAVPADDGMDFILRLDRWVAGFDQPEHRWSAFHGLRYFFFVGQHETDELYRCAVQHIFLRWLSDHAGLDIFAEDFPTALQAEANFCWPCPVTDSLRINSLLHRTGIDSQSLRPDWLSLKQLGDRDKIEKYVSKKNIKYLVLFEDFVGSGQQCERAAKFALQAFPGPILLVPLIVCHPGDEILRQLALDSGGRLTYSPVVVLNSECLIGEMVSENEPKSFDGFRKAMDYGYKKGGFNLNGGAYGYDKVGSLASSYSNCPNNTPPIFHAQSETWPFPLFPRKRRV